MRAPRPVEEQGTGEIQAFVPQPLRTLRVRFARYRGTRGSGDRFLADVYKGKDEEEGMDGTIRPTANPLHTTAIEENAALM